MAVLLQPINKYTSDSDKLSTNMNDYHVILAF